jgi:hypothetical protein
MIHQLNRDGFLPHIIMDRGVITNSVWGVLNDRVSLKSVYQELDYMIDSLLFKNAIFFHVSGTSPEERSKDVWDYMDEKIPQEIELFNQFFSYISMAGVKTFEIENKFDAESLASFQTQIKNLK